MRAIHQLRRHAHAGERRRDRRWRVADDGRACAPLCIIAIERDKPQAMEAIEAPPRALDDPRLKLAEVPTIYPAGGERQLVELLTGDEVPSGRYPGEFGYVCQNVGTALRCSACARRRAARSARRHRDGRRRAYAAERRNTDRDADRRAHRVLRRL